LQATTASGPCAGLEIVGLALTASADDPDLVWANVGDDRRIPITWPVGYFVQFDPDATIMSSDSSVIAHENDPLPGRLSEFGLNVCITGDRITIDD
jgi:hypothetical protein